MGISSILVLSGGLPAITVVAIGETEGAMSGLAIGIAGLITVFLVPLLLYLFGY